MSLYPSPHARVYLGAPLGPALLTSGVFMMRTPAVLGCSHVCCEVAMSPHSPLII